MKSVSLNRTRAFSPFWLLQTVAWVACGLVLFISGLTHQSILSSLVRNGTFVFLGLALSFGLHWTYRTLWERFNSAIVNGLSIPFLSYVTGLVSGLILNPITFIGFHSGLGDDPLRAMLAGVLNFSLVFMTWSAFYHALVIIPNKGDRSPLPQYLKRLMVEKGKRIVPVKTEEITHLEADKDYVKVHLSDEYYLIRKRLQDLESQLDPKEFQRIHRSSIVNLNFIDHLNPHINGEYFVRLSTGQELKLSRSYSAGFKAIFQVG